MDTLCKELQKCDVCRFNSLLINKYNKKFGYGKYGCHTYSQKAKVMIIGQNPSHVRYPPPLDHSLSGRQGDLFREIFGKENLIMTNLVPYSTIDNEITYKDIGHGLFHLLKQINRYKPELIIGLGKWVREALEPLSQLHMAYKLKDRIIFLAHPDYYLVYHHPGIEEYRQEIEAVHKRYLQKITTSI
jgi:uracil-DNA glycosylase